MTSGIAPNPIPVDTRHDESRRIDTQQGQHFNPDHIDSTELSHDQIDDGIFMSVIDRQISILRVREGTMRIVKMVLPRKTGFDQSRWRLRFKATKQRISSLKTFLVRSPTGDRPRREGRRKRFLLLCADSTGEKQSSGFIPILWQSQTIIRS
jgi:hypothetical protein